MAINDLILSSMPNNLESDPLGGGLQQARMAGNPMAQAKSDIENAEGRIKVRIALDGLALTDALF
jgi:hypothetical protein